MASPEWVCTITNRNPMTKVSTAITARLTVTRQAGRRGGIDVTLQQHAEPGVLPNLGLDGRRVLVDVRCDRVELRPASSRQDDRGPGDDGGADHGGDDDHAHRLPRARRLWKPLGDGPCAHDGQPAG